MESIARLVAVAGSLISANAPAPVDLFKGMGRIGVDLLSMLRAKNGFYALDSALHVFPATNDEQVVDVNTWNSPSLWRHAYGDLLDGYLFFAEDIFGQQYGLREGKIEFVDMETGQGEYFAHSLEEWAARILEEPELNTGYPLARDWQAKQGPIPAGHRLVPKMPFVCGGEFNLENLYLADAVQSLLFRGHLAVQIKDLPDGAKIDFVIINDPEQRT